jgi:integrase
MRGVFERQKGSKKWWISYYDDEGRHHREYIGGHAAAVEAYVNKKREIREGKFISPDERRKKTPTFAELFRMRMAGLERNLSRKTIVHHENNFSRLDSLKGKVAKKIRPEEIEAVFSELHKNGVSAATIRNYRALISSVFAYGISQGILVLNPVLKTKAQKAAKERVRFLSKEDEEAIRKKVREFWPEREAEFDVLLHTGMRSGEIYLLTWERVDLERGVISVPDGGKTGWRDIPINSICRKGLETLHVQSRGSEFVVPRCGKDQNWMLNKWFSDVVEKAGVLHATPHTLRHTFASRLVMAGVDLRQVQEFLGHASIVQTMRYAHLSPEHGKAAIERLVAPAAPSAADRVVEIGRAVGGSHGK